MKLILFLRIWLKIGQREASFFKKNNTLLTLFFKKMKLLVILFLVRLYARINIFWVSFIKRQTSDTSSDNEWQQITMSGKTSGNEWYNKWQQVTTNDNKWQRVVISVNFTFFLLREKSTTKHSKENSLNLEEDLEEGSLN